MGFTGTRNGMTAAQRAAFRRIVAEAGPDEFHHGDCVGADAEAHDDVTEILPACKRVVHPPVDQANRAFMGGDESRQPKTHLARNRDIVEESDFLVGASVSDVPLDRGGTWYTIDYAIRRGKTVRVVWPDGHVTEGRDP